MTHKKSNLLNLFVALFFIAASLSAKAQDWKTEEKFNVLFGLSQPVLCHGFNFEFNYIHKRIIVDFSQGVFLEFKGNALPNELRNQGVDLHMPWTVGFGVGYRITEWLNLRVEPKWHRFEFYYDNEDKYQSNQITSYNTFTLGLGLYGSYQPFKNKNNFLKGLMISPSIRYWPTVNSTLKNNNFTYMNQHTGTSEEIKTYGPGFGLTPFIVNVSIGYSFQIKKKN
jgi:hypothetical protein